MPIADYKNLSLLHTTRVSRIYRAREQLTGRQVIVKVAQRDPMQDIASLLERDYRLAVNHPVPWRLTPLAFQQESGHCFAIFDDPGGEALDTWVKNNEGPLHGRLSLALALVDMLDGIHREGLIHKDFSGPNILLTPGPNPVHLLDFSLSTPLSREDTELSNFGLMEGHPAYCAPEQSGRMNRSIDARSDHYALGATLYQLFTGSPPFSMTSTMGLLHAHIAIAPTPPAAKSIELPKALSDVILKLLEKTPEGRYQSLSALRHDLLIIEQEWRDNGMRCDFIPGETDQQHVFTVSPTLYGRQAEQQQLVAGLNDAVNGGTAVTMVAGAAGTGKTAVVQAIYGPLTQSQAYYVSGKFDQLHRDQPYTALMGAIQQLLRGILTEPEERLEPWRQALRAAVGSHGGLLTPLIPELEWIIGCQSKVEYLGPDESSRVFSRITLRVIHVFCSRERPLVMYIDDLQWADRASLQLLEQLLHTSTSHFYFIGAYRDDEVASGHFLHTLLKSLEAHSIHYRHVILSPLSAQAVTTLLADSLAQPEEQVRTLGNEVLNKTGGVPFFVHQFLQSLYRQGHITPDPETHHWHMSLESLQELPATENQIGWMAAKLRLFDTNSQQILQTAACLGARFSLLRLARLESVPLDELMRRFQPFLEAGLISISRQAGASPPSSGNDRLASNELTGHFAHDRIQQAAYRLMSHKDQRQQHRRIGELLLEETAGSKEALGRQLFEIVQQMNHGETTEYDANTRLELARLNGQAGQQASRASAHDASFHFYCQAIQLLPDDTWDTEYALTLSLHDGAQKAAFLSQQYQEMQEFGECVLRQARDLLDTRATYIVRIQAYNVQNHLDRAIVTGKAFLSRLGVKLPEHPATLHTVIALARTQLQLHGKTASDLRSLPEMQEPVQLAIMETIYRLGSSAYLGAPKLFPLLIMKMVRLAARHGHAPAYGIPYAPYCIVLCGVLHQYERGFELARLSLELAEHPQSQPLKCHTKMIVYTFAWHWTRYAGESIDGLRQAYEEGLESGDHEYAGYCGTMEVITSLFIGRPLATVAELATHYYPVIQRLSAGSALSMLQIQAQVVENLRSTQLATPWQLRGRFIPDEAAFSQVCGQDETSACSLLTAQLMLRYRFGRPASALPMLEELDLRADSIRATLIDADHHFFGGLVRMALYPKQRGKGQRNLYRKIQRHRKRVRAWAKAAPINFRHWHELLEAEWARIQGRPLAALHGYETAIASAQDHGFVQDQALAEELAGNLCRTLELQGTAQAFHAAARGHYRQWGAPALADRLASTGLAEAWQQDCESEHWYATDMELASFKASLMNIARSQVHSAMMEHVIKGAVTFAGAQSGHLLLARPNGGFYLEASYEVEGDQLAIFQALPLEKTEALCQGVINFVAHAQANLVIDDAQKPQSLLPHLHSDPQVEKRKVRSILCVPLSSDEHNTRVMGALYLENNATAGAFTPQRLELLEIICLTAAGRLELSRRAVTDGLTHLYNHEYFFNLLEAAIQLANRQSRPLSVVMLDVDHFKHFNDRWGHQCGDRALQHIANVMTETARNADVIARYGGEEFAIILPDTALAEAIQAAERIRSNIESRCIDHEGETLWMTTSLGVAQLTPDMATGTDLILQADKLLYEAKRNGRNQVAY